MIVMDSKDIVRHLEATLIGRETVIQGVSTDTRTLKPNNLYVAIVGHQHDGHQFVVEAKNKGAAALLVTQKVDVDLPQMVVKDTIQALGQLSVLWRKKFNIPLVGITGSNGKTTLKNMVASILQTAAGAVLATQGNLNNHI